jgi:hypothetical protein
MGYIPRSEGYIPPVFTGDNCSGHCSSQRSHLSISFFFSYRFKCSRHKKSKVEYRISNNIAVTTRGEEPHIAAHRCTPPRPANRRLRRCCRCPPPAARPPPPAARRTQSRTFPSPHRTSAHSPYPLHQAALRGRNGLLGLLLLLGDGCRAI